MSLWLFVLLLALSSLLEARGVRVMFNPQRPEVGPFPNDFLTVPDETQRTRIRVNVPLPDCTSQPSTCGELSLVNQFDGFNLQARLSVRFSGPIDPNTLRNGIFYVWLDPLIQDEFGLGPAGKVTPINQVEYDPATSTAYAKPDTFFDQTRRYAIFVTDAVQDVAGDPVETDEGFKACLARQIGGEYCERVGAAVAAWGKNFTGRRIIGGAVFTTMSTTAFMEKARASLQDTMTMFRRTGSSSAFKLSDLRTVVWRQQIRTVGDLYRDVPVPVGVLAQAGIGRVAFASFRSSKFLSQRLFIPQQPTAAPVEAPAETEEIFFHVWLPATPPPPGGYPVVMMGHGIGDSRFGGPTATAIGLVSRGFAVVAMNAFGHGFGPQGQLVVTDNAGNRIEIPAPGRGLDADGDGRIDDFEGCYVGAPGFPIGLRDCLRQTALDYVQLVRVLRAGVDLDGDGQFDLSQTSFGFLGQSLGSFYGSLLTAIEPNLPVSVLNVGGSAVSDLVRNSRSFRPLLLLYLAGHQPSLLTSRIALDEESALRYEPVRILSPDGAAVQSLLELFEWIETPGAPQAFATHFRSSTLPGVPIKRVLFQMALGDTTVPNPGNTALVRAANMRESTSLYRHDIARAVVPQLPLNPHAYLAGVLGTPPELAIAIAAQVQAALFMASDREDVPEVNQILTPFFGKPLFEVPAVLPEGLNFAN